MGSALILVALSSWPLRILFWILGIAAIWAAINYTAGSNPYGYKGKGDISVFLFFGMLAVMGCYFLQLGGINWEIILPAIACGTLSVGVLNVNNIRDIDSDQEAGKESIPVKIGKPAALRYHTFLICIAIISLSAYTLLNYAAPLQWLFLLALPLFIIHLIKVYNSTSAAELDPMLKQLALSTAGTITLFLIGHLL